MSRNILSRSSRGVKHFSNLKNDLEENPERLLISLPLFVRIMFLDQNPWIREINRFDFTLLAKVHSDFGKVTNRFSSHSISESILPYESQNKVIEIDQFLSEIIIESKESRFSVRDFCLAVAYNGGLHMISDIEKYRRLYEEFIEIHASISMNFVTQISQVLTGIFEQQFKAIGSKPFGFSYYQFAPIMYDNGKMLSGLLYNKSFLQFALKGKKRHGIRICIDLLLIDQKKSKGTIFSVGHSKRKESLFMSLTQEIDFLIFGVRIGGKSEQLKLKISESYYKEYQRVEFCVYPNGNISIAINHFLKQTSTLNTQVSFGDSKLLMGASLDRKRFGNFHSKTIIVQSVNSSNKLNRMRTNTWKLEYGIDYSLPYNCLERPFLKTN